MTCASILFSLLVTSIIQLVESGKINIYVGKTPPPDESQSLTASPLEQQNGCANLLDETVPEYIFKLKPIEVYRPIYYLLLIN